MRQTGSVIGVALFGSLIAGSSFVDGFRVALAISIVLLAAGCLLAMWHRSRWRLPGLSGPDIVDRWR